MGVTSQKGYAAHKYSHAGNSKMGHTAHRSIHRAHDSHHIRRHHGHIYHTHIGYHYHPFYYGNYRYYVHCGRYYRWDPYWGYEEVAYPCGWYFSTLPFRSFPVYVGNNYYYYGNGTWFYPKNNGYEVVETPLTEDEALVIPELPYECAAVEVNGKTYYVGEGTWFISLDNGYQVVDAPIEGATIIEELPADNKKVEKANQDFFTADSKWFIPVEGGYMEIKEPVVVEVKSLPTENAATDGKVAAEEKAETRAIESAGPAPIKELPTYTKVVNIDGKRYFFVNGVWYEKNLNNEFISVASPLPVVETGK